MLKKIILTFSILVFSILLSYGTKLIIENKAIDFLNTNPKITKNLKSFSSFKCDILPFNCYIKDLELKNISNKIKTVSIKKASIDALSIFNIVKFLNNENNNFFYEPNKYHFKFNLQDIKINNYNFKYFNKNNFNQFNIEIDEHLRSKEKYEAEDNTEFLITTNNNEKIGLIKIKTKIFNQKNKLHLKLSQVNFEILNKYKKIVDFYMNEMYNSYINSLKEFQNKFKLKDNSIGQVILINEYLNKYSLYFDINNSERF